MFGVKLLMIRHEDLESESMVKRMMFDMSVIIKYTTTLQNNYIHDRERIHIC